MARVGFASMNTMANESFFEFLRSASGPLTTIQKLVLMVLTEGGGGSKNAPQRLIMVANVLVRKRKC